MKFNIIDRKNWQQKEFSIKGRDYEARFPQFLNVYHIFQL